MEGVLAALYLTGMALVVLFFRGVGIVTEDDHSSAELASPQGQRPRSDSADRS